MAKVAENGALGKQQVTTVIFHFLANHSHQHAVISHSKQTNGPLNPTTLQLLFLAPFYNKTPQKGRLYSLQCLSFLNPKGQLFAPVLSYFLSSI